jgi:hypothetical protein
VLRRNGDKLRSDERSYVQQQGLLDRLRQADDQAVAFDDLSAGGIRFPAAVVSELELKGYVFEQAYHRDQPVSVRLVHEPPGPSTGRRWRRPRRR